MLAENVVAWCRLRDRMMLHLEKDLRISAAITSISVVWSLMAGLMAALQWTSGAPQSPYFLSCVWYATGGEYDNHVCPADLLHLVTNSGLCRNRGCCCHHPAVLHHWTKLCDCQGREDA